MKLWLITQEVNFGYDTYDSAVVAANNAQRAQELSPDTSYKWHDGQWWYQLFGTEKPYSNDTWATPDNVKAVYLGKARANTPEGVLCASFNAG